MEVIVFEEKQLRKQLHQQIDTLPESQLIELADWLEQNKARKKERILSYAGSWDKLSDETFDSLVQDLSTHRASTRRERLPLDEPLAKEYATCCRDL